MDQRLQWKTLKLLVENRETPSRHKCRQGLSAKDSKSSGKKSKNEMKMGRVPVANSCNPSYSGPAGGGRVKGGMRRGGNDQSTLCARMERSS
jgi:hypothetical protein